MRLHYALVGGGGQAEVVASPSWYEMMLPSDIVQTWKGEHCESIWIELLDGGVISSPLRPDRSRLPTFATFPIYQERFNTRNPTFPFATLCSCLRPGCPLGAI